MYYCKMRKVVLPLFLLLFCLRAMAQQASLDLAKTPASSPIAVSAGFSLPTGQFSTTHWGAAGIGGSSSSAQVAFFHPYKLRFAWCGGAVYYFGKKEAVAGYPYTYPGYISIYGMAGIMFSPYHKTAVNMLAGPALGLYDGSTRFNLGLRADIDYYLDKTWAISPGFMLVKENGARPLGSASLRVLFIPGN